MTNKILTETVLEILRQPGLARLGFQLGGLLVTGQKLAAVTEAIQCGKIACLTVSEFKSQGADELVAGMSVAARYEIKNNAMVFESANYGKAPGEDRTIVHESVHAMFDLHAGPKGAQNLAVEDEAAAVLTEAFYIRLCDKRVGGFKMMAEGPQEAALDLVDGLLAGNLNTIPGTFLLKPEQTQMLLRATAKDWNFTKYVGKDGLPTDNSKARYVYDGIVKCSAK